MGEGEEVAIEDGGVNHQQGQEGGGVLLMDEDEQQDGEGVPLHDVVEGASASLVEQFV